MLCGGPCFHMDPLCKRCWLKWPELQQPKREWPDWARELMRLHQRTQRLERGMLRNEHFSDYAAELYECLAYTGEVADET
jgi:hypothetical protein